MLFGKNFDFFVERLLFYFELVDFFFCFALALFEQTVLFVFGALFNCKTVYFLLHFDKPAFHRIDFVHMLGKLGVYRIHLRLHAAAVFRRFLKKAMMVSIPTSSGTGSEVTPFAIITDADTRAKWPITDYELLPNMAIIDADNMMDQPKGLTSSSGIDALTHALEAYASIMATDFTDGMALQATKLIFDYLPTAYEKGAGDPHARERMGNASTLAGMAFANAFLGICHSMAHKLGAYHHLPHGISNALLIEHVMRYNANPAPKKMGTFPQYPYPKAKARYCEMARFVGITGKDEDEIFENFIKAIADLKEKVGIKRTIKEYGIEEKDFMKTLDEMVENAFNDQCTSSNPH